ncbi:MAG: recombinase family protein [Desulfovibrionaceae bacterium]|nr:recombinase family protein [Desulfovibrionaceae bacterium]
MENVFGYIRVSSIDQNEGRQLAAFAEKAIPKDHIFVDKQSGKDFLRPQYQALLRRLRPGDQLVVTSIDRLGRNYKEIQQQWHVLTREKQVDILVLDMPLLDTRRDKDLLGTFIADLVLQVLSFVAQNERENIRRRQAEGIAIAKLNGVRFGPRPRPVPDNFPDVLHSWRQGEISLSEAARRTNMARSTFRKKTRLHESNASSNG